MWLGTRASRDSGLKAEGEGFEPPDRRTGQRLSRQWGLARVGSGTLSCSELLSKCTGSGDGFRLLAAGNPRHAGRR